MDLVDEVGPGGADVGHGAVGGSVVDEEADVIVACLVGIVVVELIVVSAICFRRKSGSLPHPGNGFGR